MRTVNFRDDVLFPVCWELGLDPDLDLNKDHARAITNFINQATQTVWELWDWPELDVTEERAFRPIWNATKSFYLADPNNGNQPSELFYIPLMSYYSVLPTAPSDPPVGTLPTNTTYFQPLTPIDKYISFDQPCRQAIGLVMGIYSGNPRTSVYRGLRYRPSEKGIDVAANAPATVFVRFQIRPSKFTSQLWSGSATYNPGDLVLAADGNVYRAMFYNTNATPAPNSAYWALVPMPYSVSQYVMYAAAAAAAEDPARKQELTSQAENGLGRAIDNLLAQGQILPRYQIGFRRAVYIPYGLMAWLDSIAWGAGSSTVTTLTDACVDPYGESEADFLVDEAGVPVTDELGGIITTQ